MMLVAVDAGGSRSRVLAQVDSHRQTKEFGSLNPASVGTTEAEHTLVDIAAWVASLAAGRRVVGWWASSTVGQVAAGAAALQVQRQLTAAGVSGRFRISNDAVPLLFAAPLCGRGAVVVAGTGSGFWAADGHGNVRVAGGYEYLASDEGSAFDMGLHGVRRAARALDGRAGGTAMLDRLVAQQGPDIVGFFRSLAAAPDPKPLLAGLARVVTDSWLDGDGAAGEVVLAAAGNLCEGVRAVRRAAALAPCAPTLLTGGVFTGCPPFAELVAELLRQEYGAHSITVAPSPVCSIADALDFVHTRTDRLVSAASSAFVHEFDTAREHRR
jgi:N-acetylglucosamine kinase-like BadF-type ATPase